MSSMVLDGATPRSRSTDPVTSVDAGRSVSLSESQKTVMVLLHEIGWPVTDRELVYHAMHRKVHYSPQRLRSARKELVDAGLVEVLEGEYRISDSGRREQIWRPVHDADESDNESEMKLWP